MWIRAILTLKALVCTAGWEMGHRFIIWNGVERRRVKLGFLIHRNFFLFHLSPCSSAWEAGGFPGINLGRNDASVGQQLGLNKLPLVSFQGRCSSAQWPYLHPSLDFLTPLTAGPPGGHHSSDDQRVTKARGPWLHPRGLQWLELFPWPCDVNGKGRDQALKVPVPALPWACSTGPQTSHFIFRLLVLHL